MIEENIKLLTKEFNRIKKMEYVKSIRKGNTGVNITFKQLLNRNNSLKETYGIDIKIKRSYSKAHINLFSAKSNENEYVKIKKIGENQIKDPKSNNVKTLNIDIFINKIVKVERNYYFNLCIDKNQEKIYLQIYDCYNRLIDKSIYWDFNSLKEKLYEKIQVLALIKAWPSKLGEYEYFKYYKMNIYILKSFDTFIELIEKDIIKINIKIKFPNIKTKYSKALNYNANFGIKEEDLLLLFNIYR